MLAAALPPASSGSAVVVENLVRHFDADEMVVVGEQPSQSRRDEWASEWPARYFVSKARFTGWPAQGYLRRAIAPFQVPMLVLRIARIARRERSEVLLVNFPDARFLLAGYLVARTLRIPLVSYFHNTYADNRRGVEKIFAAWLQERVFRRSSHVFAMSEGMAQVLRGTYPVIKHCSALVHCVGGEPAPAAPLPRVRSPVRVLLLGSVNHACLDATLRLVRVASSGRRALVRIVSPTPAWVLRKWGALGPGVEHVPSKLTRDELRGEFERADLVYLPLGLSGTLANVEYRTIFPTRTLDYLVCGRPILAHVPRDSTVGSFLKAEGCALVVDTADDEALAGALERMTADDPLRADLVRRAAAAAAHFSPQRVVSHLRTTLGHAITAGREE
jgi:glycosyltransferase involved in cell wall biosynthesis